MLFLKYIPTERVDEYSVIRSELQADPDSGRLVVTEAVFMGGTWRHTWTFAAASKDLDPGRVSLEPEDSSGVRYLTAVCAFYRRAVEGDFSGFDASQRHARSAKLCIPLVGKRIDSDRIVRSYRDFLLNHGARTPTIRPAIILDHVMLLQAAVAPACGVRVYNKAKTGWNEYAVSLDTDQLLLKSETRRGSKLPLERNRKAGPKWSFELLSLDTAAAKVCNQEGCWIVVLPAVESLQTCLCDAFGPASIMKIYFQSQAEAEHFAGVCVRVVPEIRQRLYDATFEN